MVDAAAGQSNRAVNHRFLVAQNPFASGLFSFYVAIVLLGAETTTI
jgi:hypothetical protein